MAESETSPSKPTEIGPVPQGWSMKSAQTEDGRCGCDSRPDPRANFCCSKRRRSRNPEGDGKDE